MLKRQDRRFGDLSGGQKQRVLVARAIVSRPKLILLDEPFNGLDQPNRVALLEIIEAVKAEGVAVIVSTHDHRLPKGGEGAAVGQPSNQFGFREVLVPELIAEASAVCPPTSSSTLGWRALSTAARQKLPLRNLAASLAAEASDD